MMVITKKKHYVLRGGGLEKCCNLQNPMNTSCQLGQVEICSTLRGLIYGHFVAILWHFLPQNGHIWPQAVPVTPNGLNIGWTGLNIVLHIWGGEFGPFLPPKNGIWGPRNPQKWPFLAKNCHIGQSQRPQMGWTLVKHGWILMWNMIFNHVQPMPKPFGVAKTTYGQIWQFLAKKGHFWGVLGPPNSIFWGAKRPQTHPSRCEVQC